MSRQFSVLGGRVVLSVMFLLSGPFVLMGRAQNDLIDESGISAGLPCLNTSDAYCVACTSDCPVDAGRGHYSYSVAPVDDVKLLLGMGDSITVGRSSDPNYFRQLNRYMKDLYPDSNFYAYNAAVGGSTMKDVVAGGQLGLVKRLIELSRKPTIVVMTAGGNDLRNALEKIVIRRKLGIGDAVKEQQIIDNQIAETVENLRTIVTTLQGISVPVSFYIAVVHDPTDGVGSAEVGCGEFNSFKDSCLVPCALAKLRAEYMNLAAELHFGVVDALGSFHGHGAYFCDASGPYYDAQNPSLYLTTDCLHPNQKGHDNLFQLFVETIYPSRFWIGPVPLPQN